MPSGAPVEGSRWRHSCQDEGLRERRGTGGSRPNPSFRRVLPGGSFGGESVRLLFRAAHVLNDLMW